MTNNRSCTNTWLDSGTHTAHLTCVPLMSRLVREEKNEADGLLSWLCCWEGDGKNVLSSWMH